MKRLYYIFITLCVTAVLIFTVFIRTTQNQTFFKFFSLRYDQNQLKQKIGNKQLKLESLINAALIKNNQNNNEIELQ